MQTRAETAKIDRSWYAVRVRSRFENVVASHLRARNRECFLPSFKTRRRWSDRIMEIELPLVNIVGVGRAPLPVNDIEMAALQTTVRSRLEVKPWPFLTVGNRVKIFLGPLAGVDGILLEFRGVGRLVLSLTLLQRSVAVEVDESWIKPLPAAGSSATGAQVILSAQFNASIAQN